MLCVTVIFMLVISTSIAIITIIFFSPVLILLSLLLLLFYYSYYSDYFKYVMNRLAVSKEFGSFAAKATLKSQLKIQLQADMQK